jgi:hypothetical protein
MSLADLPNAMEEGKEYAVLSALVVGVRADHGRFELDPCVWRVDVFCRGAWLFRTV